MIHIAYKPTFIREYRKLPKMLQEEADEKIALFARDPRLPSLRMHKLKGKHRDCWSFSVNYSHRIIFHFENKKAVLLDIGDHSVYE